MCKAWGALSWQGGIDSKGSAETIALACKAGAYALLVHASGCTCKPRCN